MKIRNITIFLLFTSFLIYHPDCRVSAATVNESKEKMATKVISADDYILMPGDSILITITGSTNYSYITGITLEGKVTVNLPVASAPRPLSTAETAMEFGVTYDIVEAVPIYDISLSAAKDSLKNVFLKYFRSIKLDITLLSMRTFTVLVAGEVNRPGIAIARPINRVSTIIDTVGGVNPIGSRSRIQLMRNGRLLQLVDLAEFERTGNTEANPFVQDGDLIYVPRMEKSVTVIGAVYEKRKYGSTESEMLRFSTESAITPTENITQAIYELIEGETVSDIIAKAGITPWADLSNVYIERGDQTIIINLNEVFADENSGYNILMKDGDVLYVPSVNTMVYIQGSVVNPGVFLFQPNMRASAYISMAGGPIDEANISGAYIRRGKKRISLKKDPLIEKGDQIIVPRQVFKFWQDYLEIGSVLASLFLSYLTWTAVTSK